MNTLIERDRGEGEMGEDSDDRRVSPQLTSPRWLAPGPAPSFERPSSERKNHRSAEKCSTDLKVVSDNDPSRPVSTLTSNFDAPVIRS